MTSMPKEVWILTLCQVLFTAAISIDLTITSLAGQSLTLHPELATIPFALLTVGGALIMPILGWQIRYHGRRNALITGCCIGVAGALISTISTLIPHFWGLCLGCLLVGAFQASAQFYRLAAGDLVRQELKQFAVSLVLAGGVIAAFLGPGLAVWSASLYPSSLFTGSYLAVSILILVSALLLVCFYKTDGKPALAEASKAEWAGNYAALKKPVYLVATINGVLITSVMMLMMSSAPLAIVKAGLTMKEGAAVMQWHLVGMYAPSLVAGYTFRKLGAGMSLMIGISLTVLAALVGMQGTQLATFYWSLALLGVGWNLSFVTSSILLSLGNDSSMRKAAQTASETLRYLFSSAASLLSAAALEYFGWHQLNIIMLPFLLVGLCVTGCWIIFSRTTPHAG